MSSRQITSRDNKALVNSILVDQQAKEDRLNRLSTVEYSKLKFVHLSQYIMANVAVASGSPYTSPDIRAISGIGPTAKAFFGVLRTNGPALTVTLSFGSSDDTLDAFSQYYLWASTGAGDKNLLSQMVLIPLGVDGKFIMQSNNVNNTNVYLTAFAILE